jgi:NAD(P)-dependent dehydrogenase (short-subunit alcohol dehydrogenase family)
MTEAFGQALAGRAILITGGFQGLGLEIARHAAANGAKRIVLCGRDRDKGEAAASGIAGAEILLGDLAEPDTPRALIEQALAGGDLDGLVNAAGLTDRAGFLDGDLAVWDRLFAVNARAPFFLMQGFIAHRLARKAPGAIVNILSMNAHCGAPDLSIYSATKGALSTLTRNAAHAYLADRIRVNGINMGWSPTTAEHHMQGEILGKGASWAEDAAAAMPLKRMLEPQEVARLAIYLLSDLSGLQTGTLIDLEQRVLGAPGR